MVCTGNICRSPFAERLLRARLAERLGAAAARIEVTSAGTWGLVDEAMVAEAAQTLHRYGGDSTGFVSRALAEQQIEEADLVLGMTREHRAAAVTMVPRASGRTVTLLEYARLLSGVDKHDLVAAGPDPVERFRAITAAAFGRRGLVPLGHPGDDDVPDPYGGPVAGYDRAAALIDRALRVPLALLVG
jgi:protein-tyrosine phosphatase